MDEDKKYPLDLLKSKSKEDLIQIIDSLQEEVAMLDFLLKEYEAMQASVGKALKKKIEDTMSTIVLDNTEIGEA